MASVQSSSSSVGDQGAKVDRFSTLPPEILDIIYDFARLPFRRDSGPLSRGLLPCYLRSLYRRVFLVRRGSLPEFVSTIEARAGLGSLVRELAANARDGPQFSGSEAFDVILRRLDLLESLSVSWLFSTLPSLPRHTHLTELSYGCTVLRACDLEPLSELVNLTHLEIKFTKFSNEGEDRLGLLTHNHIKVLGKEGRPVDVDDTVVDGGVWQSMDDAGWVRPDFAEWNDEDLARLPDVGRRNGVQVSGSSFGAKSRIEAYELEKANRVILRTYQTESLAEYLAIRDAGDCPRLPEIDIDNFEHLELVKIDLPEEDWFQLTLE
ncbi:hypothetical protein JCM3766R1_001858 [Sporobolomyces carnicolor]